MDRQLVIDYKQTFETPQGKRVLEHIKKLARFNSSYWPVGTDSHTDIYQVCREDGKRAVINHIDIMLTRNPDEEEKDLITRKEDNG
jgi:hypothetical protein